MFVVSNLKLIFKMKLGYYTTGVKSYIALLNKIVYIGDNTQLCRPILHNILLRWDLEKGSFSHKNRSIPLTVDKICLVMGFCNDCSTVEFKGDDIPKSNLREKYFIPKYLGMICRIKLRNPPNNIVGLISLPR
jgi:hypothetical protein